MVYNRILGFRNLVITLLILVSISMFFLVFSGIYHKTATFETTAALVSVITFVYAFFVNSMLRFIEKKYVQFKLNMADFSSNLQSFYNIILVSKQEELRLKIRSILLEFLESLKKLRTEDYHLHQDYMNKIFSTMKEYKIKSEHDKINYSQSFISLQNMSLNRERLEIFGHGYLVGESRILFVVLTALTVSTVVLATLASPVKFLFGLILIFALIFTANLLFKMDSLAYGGSKIRRHNLDDLIKFVRDNWANFKEWMSEGRSNQEGVHI